MNTLALNDGTIIGPGHPAFIIAEAGICHNGSMSTARKLIEVAKDSGADCVKFQKRDINSLFTKDVLLNTENYEQGIQYILRYIRKYELSEDEMESLKGYADDIGIMFSCTPFDTKSFDFLKTLNLPFYKIGSPVLHDIFLVEEMAKSGTPLIVSVGMSHQREIDYSIRFLLKSKVQFAICHCVSSYPCDFTDINLEFMNVLREKYNVAVGYSGHERGIAIASAAVAMGANIIEKHLTLDRSSDNPDNRVSLEPQGFKKMVRDIRNVEKAIGTKSRYLTRSEYTTRESLSKSLVAKTNIPIGKKIKMNDLAAKCPGNGIAPSWSHTAVGLISKRNIKRDEQITPMDVGLLESVNNVTYPYQFGIVGRFSDVDSMMWQKPKFVEFHLTDSDLQSHLQSKRYDCDFSFHYPEYVGSTLIDISSFDEDIRKMSVDIVNRSMDIAATARHFCSGNKPRMIVHPGGGFMSDDKVDTNKLYSNLSRSINELRRDDVEIIPECMPPLPIYFGGVWYQQIFPDPIEIANFCKKEGVRLCLDVSHAGLFCNFSGWHLVDYLNELKKHIGHIHFADYMGVGGEGLQIEDGECDWASVMEILPYKTVPSINEVWRGHMYNGYGFALGMQRLQKYIT